LFVIIYYRFIQFSWLEKHKHCTWQRFWAKAADIALAIVWHSRSQSV